MHTEELPETILHPIPHINSSIVQANDPCNIKYFPFAFVEIFRSTYKLVCVIKIIYNTQKSDFFFFEISEHCR